MQFASPFVLLACLLLEVSLRAVNEARAARGQTHLKWYQSSQPGPPQAPEASRSRAAAASPPRPSKRRNKMAAARGFRSLPREAAGTPDGLPYAERVAEEGLPASVQASREGMPLGVCDVADREAARELRRQRQSVQHDRPNQSNWTRHESEEEASSWRSQPEPYPGSPQTSALPADLLSRGLAAHTAAKGSRGNIPRFHQDAPSASCTCKSQR